VDIELVPVAAVRAQTCGQDSAVRAGAGLRHGIEHDRTRPVSKQHASAAIAPIKQTRIGLGPDDKRPLEAPRLKESVGSREREDEAGTYRLQVERRSVGDAEAGLDRDRGGRESVVRRRGCEHDKVDRLRIDIAVDKRSTRSGEPKVRRAFAWRRNPTLANPGTLGDPFVGSVDLPRQFGVGEDATGQVTPAAEHDRASNRHEGTLSAAVGGGDAAGSWPSNSEAPPRQ